MKDNKMQVDISKFDFKQPVVMVLRKYSELGDQYGLEFDDPYGFLRLSSEFRSALLSNPFLKEDGVAEIFGVLQNTVIGRQFILPLECVAHGKIYRVVAGSTSKVAKEFRRTLFALDMDASIAKCAPDGGTISAGLSMMSRKMCKLKKSTLFEFHQAMYYVRFRAFIGRRNPAWLWNLLRPFMDIILFLQRMIVELLVAYKFRGLRFEEINNCGLKDLEIVADLIAGDAHVFRQNMSVDWFKWVLENDFHNNASADKRIFLVYSRNEPIGFYLSRKEHDGTGRIVEWQLKEPYEYLEPWLILHGAKRLASDGCTSVLLSSANETSAAVWRSLGFRRVCEQFAVVGCLRGYPLREMEGFFDKLHWRLRPGMGDASLY